MDMSERVFQARLEEYVSARDEMLGAISNQHLALTFGTASVVAVFVAGFAIWKQEAAPEVFFSIPLLGSWIVAMWLGEVVRMLRAVEFCTDQQRIINASLPIDDPDEPPIRWEQWRSNHTASWRTITWTYKSVIATFFLVYIGGLTGGGFTASAAEWSTWVIVLLVVAYVVLGVVLLWRLWLTYKRWTTKEVGMPGRPTTR